MKLDKKNIARLAQAGRHANIAGVLVTTHPDYPGEVNLDPELGEIEIEIRRGLYGSDDGYNWAGGDGDTADPAVRELDRLVAGHDPVTKKNRIRSCTEASCGYGSRQVAVEYDCSIAVYAETCGGHSVSLYLSREGEVTVLDTDGAESAQNWADDVDDTPETSEDDRRNRRIKKLNK